MDSVESPKPAPEKVDLTLYNGNAIDSGLDTEMVLEYESEQKGCLKRSSDKITQKTIHDIMSKVRKSTTHDNCSLQTISSSSLSKPLSFTPISQEEHTVVSASPNHSTSSFMLDLYSLLNGSSLGVCSIHKPVTEQEPVKEEPSPDEDISLPAEAKPTESDMPLVPDASAPTSVVAVTTPTPTPVLRETTSELSSLIKEAEGDSHPVVVVPKPEEKPHPEEVKPKPPKPRGHRVGGW